MMRDKPLDQGMAELFREDPAFAIDLLNELLAEGDQESLLIALRQIANALGGVQTVAEKAQLNQTQLYRTLSVDGNPSLSSLTAILKALGLQLAIRPAA